MELKEVAERLKNQNITPGELSQIHLKLAGEYGFMAGELAQIQMRKPVKWTEFRSKATSDAQADREWDLTDDGQNEIGYRLQMKAIEKMLSSIKTRINILTEEARNQY